MYPVLLSFIDYWLILLLAKRCIQMLMYWWKTFHFHFWKWSPKMEHDDKLDRILDCFKIGRECRYCLFRLTCWKATCTWNQIFSLYSSLLCSLHLCWPLSWYHVCKSSSQPHRHTAFVWNFGHHTLSLLQRGPNEERATFGRDTSEAKKSDPSINNMTNVCPPPILHVVKDSQILIIPEYRFEYLVCTFTYMWTESYPDTRHTFTPGLFYDPYWHILGLSADAGGNHHRHIKMTYSEEISQFRG